MEVRKGAKGLDAFNVVDASKGIFEIYYTTEMLSNIGNIEASLILIDSTGRIESSTFTISVTPSTIDDESVESENSFTALTEALVKVNDFDAQLAQTQKYPIKQNETGVINKNYPYGDIRRYGAIGDNITDCTQAIQSAIDNAYNLGFDVQVPDGIFLITSPLILPKSVWIKGISHNTLVYYSSQGYTQNCVIRSTSEHVFECAETNTNKKVMLKLTDVYFKNSFTDLYGAVVFYDLELYSSLIEGCTFVINESIIPPPVTVPMSPSIKASPIPTKELLLMRVSVDIIPNKTK